MEVIFYFSVGLGASYFLNRRVSAVLVKRLNIYFCHVGGARGGGDMAYDLLFPSEKACSAETRLFCFIGRVGLISPEACTLKNT